MVSKIAVWRKFPRLVQVLAILARANSVTPGNVVYFEMWFSVADQPWYLPVSGEESCAEARQILAEVGRSAQESH